MTLSPHSTADDVSGDRRDIRIQPTPQDFMDYYRVIYRTLYRQNIPYMVAVWVLVVAIGSALLKIADQVRPALAQDQPTQFILALVVYVALFYGIMKFFWKHMITSRIEENGEFLAPKTISITPEGLQKESGNLTSFVKWPGILRIEETKNCVLFYVDKANAQSIPKRALGDEQQAQAFIALAKQYHRAARDAKDTNLRSSESTGTNAPPAA